MRVLSCKKIQCPSSLICFCKPSSAAALKLENSPHVHCVSQEDGSQHQVDTPAVVPQIQVKQEEEEDGKKVESEEEDGKKVESEEEDGKKAESGDDNLVIRSCMKKKISCAAAAESSPYVQKKKVQWVDSLGKQLVHIKEFESSETGDTDNEDEEDGGCLCTIL